MTLCSLVLFPYTVFMFFLSHVGYRSWIFLMIVIFPYSPPPVPFSFRVRVSFFFAIPHPYQNFPAFFYRTFSVGLLMRIFFLYDFPRLNTRGLSCFDSFPPALVPCGSPPVPAFLCSSFYNTNSNPNGGRAWSLFNFSLSPSSSFCFFSRPFFFLPFVCGQHFPDSLWFRGSSFWG